MHDMWYRVLRRVFDLIILLLFIVILLPEHWYNRSKEPKQRTELPPIVSPAPDIESLMPAEEVPVPDPVASEDTVPHIQPMVEKPITAPAVATPTVPQPAKGIWWLQVGVFRHADAAAPYIAKLKKNNLPYRLEKLGNLYVLKVGPIADQDVAKMSRNVRSAGITHWLKTKK